MTRTLRSTLAACLILAGCAGGAPSLAPPAGDPTGGPGSPAAQLLRNSSGAPSGIRVTWDAVPEAAAYNVYRDDAPIPDSAVGSMTLRVNSTPVPAAPVSVTFDEQISPLNLGDRFYIRISTLDDTGDESELSPEADITISDFLITQLEDTTGGVGDSVDINGERFGSYDPSGDKVFFPGVTLDAGGALEPSMIEATVTSWNQSRITCTVPLGTTSGKLQVQSNGLSQDTPEVFTNSDPYIESLNPTLGFADTNVVLSGRNFGAAPDFDHRVVVDGRTLAAGNYVSYSETQVTFHLDTTFAFDRPLGVRVQVQSISSNNAEFTQANRAPIAALSANPPDGLSPLEVELDASASTEPDGDIMLFSWDWEGDGTIDFDSGVDATVTHSYASPGDFNPAVYVKDSLAATGSTSTAVHVSLSRMILYDNGTFAPNTEFYQSSFSVPISYTISGGQPAYELEWYLVDPVNGTQYLLASDVDVPYGDGIRSFSIDTTAEPEDGADSIPAGQWRILAVARDGGAGNDPDPSFSWPNFANGTPGTFFVYRYDAFVVIDTQGDPGGTESTLIGNELSKLGYKVSMKSSNNLTFADFAGRDVVVWPADAPYGDSNFVYGWLSPEELGLARQYLDAGGRMVFFGPPFAATTSPFAQDLAFGRLYQPYMQVADTVVNNQTIGLEHYAANHIYELDSFAVSGPAGISPETLQGTSEAQASVFDATGVQVYMATRSLASGGKVFLGMAVFSNITGTSPPGSDRSMLLENIVAGTIETP